MSRTCSRGLVAEPFPRSVGQDQILAEEVLREPRQVGTETAVLDDGGARGIDDGSRRPSARSQEAGRSVEAAGIELERVDRAALGAAHDEIDLLQAFERLEINLAALHPEVRSLDQEIAEVARKIGVGEIVLVVRPRREERYARVLAPAQRRQRALHAAEIRRHTHAVAELEQVAGDMGVDDAVGEREADPGERLGVAVDDSPLTARIAREVRRIEMEAAGVGHDALAGSQICSVGVDELSGHQPFAHQ